MINKNVKIYMQNNEAAFIFVDNDLYMVNPDIRSENVAFDASTIYAIRTSEIIDMISNYDFNNQTIDILRPITSLRTLVTTKKKTDEVKTFWCCGDTGTAPGRAFSSTSCLTTRCTSTS